MMTRRRPESFARPIAQAREVTVAAADVIDHPEWISANGLDLVQAFEPSEKQRDWLAVIAPLCQRASADAIGGGEHSTR